MTWKDRKIAKLNYKRLYWKNEARNWQVLFVISAILNIYLLIK